MIGAHMHDLIPVVASHGAEPSLTGTFDWWQAQRVDPARNCVCAGRRYWVRRAALSEAAGDGAGTRSSSKALAWIGVGRVAMVIG